MRLPDETVIFLHIPKTGGTTMHRLLERLYPREQIYSIGSHKPVQGVERFLSLPPEERARYRVIMGHLGFGLHNGITGRSTYITILRDPVERVISQFYHAKYRSEHYLYSRLNREDITLYEYASRRITPELSNQQTAMLSGHGRARWNAMPTRDSLNQAKENLQTHFRAVGLTEEFDSSLLVMQCALGWRSPYYLRENESASRPPAAQIDSRARELIVELNALDIELYAFARARFEAAWRELGETRQAKLMRFRARNSKYQGIAGLLKQCRTGLSRLDLIPQLNTMREK